MKMQGLFVAFVLMVVFAITAIAQSDAIKYQGRLDDGGQPANGQYDLVFRLFDLDSGGTELAPSVTIDNVQVLNGVFSAEISFSFPPFTSVAAQWLEIAVRPGNSTGSFTTLTPRQRITSAPYAMKSAYSTFSVNATTATNAQQLGGIAANQFVQTSDPRLSDARPPTAGSPNYVQNGTSQQASSNFNVSGTGRAGTFRSSTFDAIGEYQSFGTRVLKVTGDNTALGPNAGDPSFGTFNTYLGSGAGTAANSNAAQNTFAGTNAGNRTTIGTRNSFFGARSGILNDNGSSNTFIGEGAGVFTTSGGENSFLGADSGQSNSSGARNSYFGVWAGGLPTVNNSSAFGYRAFATQSNSLILGSINGVNGATADTNVGIGTTAPSQKLHVVGNSLFTGDLTISGTLNATLPAGSSSYIQNSTTAQAASNFNISGTGTANVLIASTQFNIGGNRVLSTAGTSNVFVGANGPTSFAGSGNSFLGSGAGSLNSTGSGNSFFGSSAGGVNLTGNDNSIFGSGAARFGGSVGGSVGNNNSIYGNLSGEFNTGNSNSFFGRGSGQFNTVGTGNSFFGSGAGAENGVGSFNTILGTSAGVGWTDLVNATAIGARSMVAASDSLVLGSINGVNGATADTNVGIGTTTPLGRLDVRGQILVGLTAVPGIPAPNALFIANDAGDTRNTFRLDGDSNGMYMIARSNPGAAAGAALVFRTGEAGQGETDRLRIEANGNVNIGTVGTPDKLGVNGTISFASLGTAGSTQLCRNVQNQISTCSSSARYKNNINSFTSGLDLIKKLRPVSFNWNDGGMADMGLVAEEVAEVEPLLTSTNDNGEVEGVKYDRVSVVLINAVKDQQAQIEAQRLVIDQLTKKVAELDELKAYICGQKPAAQICKAKH